MTAFAAALKAEITRIARKEIKGEVEHLRKSLTQARRDIAALKREVHDVRRASKVLTKAKPANASGTVDSDAPKRFSAKGLKSHRARLELSAADFARLVGVSAQSVYLWEAGKSSPSKTQLPHIAAIRAMGKREAAAKLASIK